MLLLLAVLQASASVASPLNLTCAGGGTANKIAVTNVYGSNNGSGTIGTMPYNYSGSGNSTAYSSRQQGFDDQVDIRLFAGDDRIRMPRTMLPPLHGGNGGWFRLKNVVADDRTIDASVAVNFMNNPKVRIDRVTGMISISGKAGDYSGQCQAIPAEAPAKF